MESEVKTIELHGSKIWIIDDVLEEPDLLARFLRKIYPKVTYVSNITDIDDKIINAAHSRP